MKERPRFVIRKIKDFPSAEPWILYDRSRPAFRFHARTHARAVHAMRNIVRREHGFGPLLEWPKASA
jgi:hypothetical protein